MVVEVYGMGYSAPTRNLFLVCEALGIDYKINPIDLFKGDNRTPEYLKMNPQHVIPTLKDGDFIMSESRPASCYLAGKYDTSGKLYPSDLKVRAVVDQRLFFDIGTFYKAAGDIMYPLLFKTHTPKESNYDRFKEVMGWVEDFIKDTGYVAGTKHFTLADISFACTYSALEATGHFNLDAYPKSKAWFKKMKEELPGYESVAAPGAAKFGELFKNAVA